MSNTITTRKPAYLSLLTKSIVLAWGCYLAALTVNAETIYRAEDKDGNIVFTDTPPAATSAEAVELTPLNTRPAVSPKPQAKGIKRTDGSYTKVYISQPTNNLTIPPGQLDIVVQLSIEPQLHDDHMVQFYMDGKPRGKPATTTSISIGNLSRGTHQIKATIIKIDSPSVLAESNTVTIHVKRASAKQ